jgi:hypothetical protein
MLLREYQAPWGRNKVISNFPFVSFRQEEGSIAMQRTFFLPEMLIGKIKGAENILLA